MADSFYNIKSRLATENPNALVERDALLYIYNLEEQLAAAQREAESCDRQSTMLSTKLQEMTAKYNVAEAARKRNLEQLDPRRFS